jgi:hypothetical protein
MACWLCVCLYGKVGCMHKYPMMVWTHQLTCREISIILSVFISFIFPSCSSMPRLLAYRQSHLLTNRYNTVILSTYNEVMLLISVMPFEKRRFKFAVSFQWWRPRWSRHLRRERFSTTRHYSPLSTLSKIKIKILGSECQTSGTCAKRAKHATKKTTPRLACVLWTT